MRRLRRLVEAEDQERRDQAARIAKVEAVIAKLPVADQEKLLATWIIRLEDEEKLKLERETGQLSLFERLLYLMNVPAPESGRGGGPPSP